MNENEENLIDVCMYVCMEKKIRVGNASFVLFFVFLERCTLIYLGKWGR